MSTSRSLSFDEYRSTTHAVWIGKFIGGTLGAPIEGWKKLHAIDVEEQIPATLAENDDTDLQLLWLHAMEERGIDLDSRALAEEWLEHVDAPWCEYGVAVANWQRGVMPPESGVVDNWYWGQSMGCPIRSEIWGVICPGAPALAAQYARNDAQLDHWGASVEAEKFLSAIQAALFFEKDLRTLIEIGLAEVTLDSPFRELISDTIEWSDTLSWQEARKAILVRYGSPDMTHSLQNLGFTVLALLAGRGDLRQTLNIALNCGFDTDCTAATAGAILCGVIGYDAIPEHWRGIVPDEYQISPWMRGFPKSGSIEALTDACCHLGIRVARERKTGIQITGKPGPQPAPLAVSPQQARSIRKPKRSFPEWRIIGPFWNEDDSLAAQHAKFPDHSADTLPSVHYMSHRASGFGEACRPEGDAPARTIAASDSRIPLVDLPDAGGPCSYRCETSFDAPTAAPGWLMLGSTGPFKAWLNGTLVCESSAYQILTPHSFPTDVNLLEGKNTLVIALEKTSQPLGASVGIKHHTGRHWHQMFWNTDLDWLSAEHPDRFSAGSVSASAEPELVEAG